MDAHLAVNIVLLTVVALMVIWSVLREKHIHLMQCSQEVAASKLVEHLGGINRLMDGGHRLIEQVMREIDDSAMATKEQGHALLNSLRDFELRMSEAIHENRNCIRDYMSKATHIYNNQSGEHRTDIHGGQNNVGEIGIHGSQNQR